VSSRIEGGGTRTLEGVVYPCLAPTAYKMWTNGNLPISGRPPGHRKPLFRSTRKIGLEASWTVRSPLTSKFHRSRLTFTAVIVDQRKVGHSRGHPVHTWTNRPTVLLLNYVWNGLEDLLNTVSGFTLIITFFVYCMRVPIVIRTNPRSYLPFFIALIVLGKGRFFSKSSFERLFFLLVNKNGAFHFEESSRHSCTVAENRRPYQGDFETGDFTNRYEK